MLTNKSKKLISANPRQEKIRLDQIMHDIAVIDVAICFMKYLDVTNIETEKQLHQEDGFGIRAHHPDIVFRKGNKSYCVEVEFSLKSRTRLEQNIKSNFKKYDTQVWVIDSNSDGGKITRILKSFKGKYPNIKVINYRRFKDGIFRFNN